MKPETRQSYTADRSATSIEGVKVGKVACFNKDSSVCVDFAGNTRKNLKARVVQSIDWNSLLNAAEHQQELLLVFEEGDASKPIIIDMLSSPIDSSVVTPVKTHKEVLNLKLPDKAVADKELSDEESSGNKWSDNGLVGKNTGDSAELQDVQIDGKRISFNAEDQIVLKCGKSSITLTKAGKVLLKGAYVLNRSSGAMRIKGGSVQIN